VAAVHGALIGGQNKGGLLILVLHADNHSVVPFTTGVFVAILGGFHGIGNTEAANRVADGAGLVDSDLFLALVDRVVVGDGLTFILRDGTEWTV